MEKDAGVSSTWLDDDEWTGGPKRDADRTPADEVLDADGSGGVSDSAGQPQFGRASDGGAWEAPNPPQPGPPQGPPPRQTGRFTDPEGRSVPPGPSPWTPSTPMPGPANTPDRRNLGVPESPDPFRRPGPNVPSGPTPQVNVSPTPTAAAITPGPAGPMFGGPSDAVPLPMDNAGREVEDDAEPARGGGWGRVLAASLVAALLAAGLTVPLTLRLADNGEEVTDSPTTQTVALPAAADDPADATTPEVEPAAPPAEITSDTVSNVAEAVLPSVAVVETAVGGQGVGSGSAVVFRQDGYLVTNNHVVEGADAVRVRLVDGRVMDAEVIGTASDFDLAVLRIDADDLQVPAYAEGDPRVGETAIAIGAPFGFNSTVTSGIVSATGRTLSDPATQVNLVDLVQTDAAINPGNSGGALVNASGQVIGLNTAIVGGGTNDGVGFAVPTSAVVRIGEQLISQGFFEYAQLGVGSVQGGVTPQIAEQRGLDTTNGALVGEVNPDSGADDAGIVPGDIVTAIDDTTITGFDDLAATIRGLTPGQTVTLDVVDESGQSRTVEVELGGIRTND